MRARTYTFTGKKTICCFGAEFGDLDRLTGDRRVVFVTDENVYAKHGRRFRNRDLIVLPAGEAHKVQATVDLVIRRLIELEADRKTVLVGVGGGVLTDIAGYAAAIYMRGIPFGFVPTSLLAMVDASIGGKNGVDVGVYKNYVGTIRQPDFLLYDTGLLKTLPQEEWVNGFAEIIKHASIRDSRMFRELEQRDLRYYRRNREALDKLVARNVAIKSAVVMADEFERGERKLLNFGHTWGHAVETTSQIPHGHAVAVGMMIACRISEALTGFRDTDRLGALLKRYGLPLTAPVDHRRVFGVLKMDKKKERDAMHFVLLEKPGKALIKKIPMTRLEELILAAGGQSIQS